MTLEHLKAFVWLRWRLRVNQARRAGTLNAVLMAVIAVAAVAAGAIGLVGGFALGLLALPEAPPLIRLLVWDGLVVAFLFGWGIGVLAELQRAEALALDKFLHLPVSPVGVFVVNYLSSFLSLTVVVIVPTMVGLAAGQAAGVGWASLLALPLVAAFVFAGTAVTYMFQGWLAALMANPRRRRTVIFAVTAGFILVFQLPNLLNLAYQTRPGSDDSARDRDRWDELGRAVATGKITPEESGRRAAEIQREAQADRDARSDEMKALVERTARVVNAVFPPGWLALGAADLAGGAVLPALLGGLGFAAIGTVGLWRAYRTTLRIYRGEIGGGSGDRRDAVRAETTGPPASRFGGRRLLVEWALPWVSEYASAVAAAGLRALARAPEVKMIMIGPLVMVAFSGVMLLRMPQMVPELVRPFIAVGAAMTAQLTSVQLIGNQFGFDRAGFRAFVLGPAPRREILLGKNLAVAPLVLGPAGLLAAAVACVVPMRVDHVFVIVFQIVSVYMLTCVMANFLSIFAPMPVSAGSFRPARVRLGPALLQMVFLAFYPLVVAPTLVPLFAEILLDEFAGMTGWPVALGLSLGVTAGVVWLYRRVLTWQGRLLSEREQAILDVVTTKEE